MVTMRALYSFSMINIDALDPDRMPGRQVVHTEMEKVILPSPFEYFTLRRVERHWLWGDCNFSLPL